MSWQILCYHEVSTRCATTFRRQLVTLLDQGWKFCTISDGLVKLSVNSPDKWITLTFDDGDTTIHTVVQPILALLNIKACAYIVTDYIARGNRYRDCQPRACTTWKQLASWIADGHEVGSHSHTHIPLTNCHPSRLRQELEISRDILEQQLGCGVQHFAYPWGQYSEEVEAQVSSTRIYNTWASIDRGIMNKPTTSLKRDIVQPNWTPHRLLWTLRWGASSLYQLRLLCRPKTNTARPNSGELWLPLEETL